jgi:hypothetical protein
MVAPAAGEVTDRRRRDAVFVATVVDITTPLVRLGALNAVRHVM